MRVTVPTGSRLPISPRRSSARRLLLGQPSASSQPNPIDRRASGTSPRRLPHCGCARCPCVLHSRPLVGARARAQHACMLRVGGGLLCSVWAVSHVGICSTRSTLICSPLLVAPNLRSDRAVLCACAGLSRKAPSRVRRASRVLSSLHARSGDAPPVPSSRELEPAVSCSRARLSEQVRQSLARPLAPPPP